METASSRPGHASATESCKPNFSPSTGRIPQLDGLRGTAIGLVLIFHLADKHPLAQGFWHYAVTAAKLTWSGVDLFFVLSGFLIGGILLDAKHSPSYYRTFYIRRATRILPIYWVLLCLFSLRFLPIRVLPHEFGDFSITLIPWWAYILFAQNFWMAVIGGLGVGLLAPTWSLAVEEQFYLTIPFLVRHLRVRTLAIVLVATVVVVPVVRILFFHYDPQALTACYVLMPCRADALSLGVLAAMLVRNPKTWAAFAGQYKKVLPLNLVLFAGVIGFTCAGPLTGAWISIRYSVLAIFYACFLVSVMAWPDRWAARLLKAPWLMKLGTISYFAYLYHIPIIELARRAVTHAALGLTENASDLFAFFLGAMVTLALAAFSWKFFESPLVRWGKSFEY